MNVPGMCHDFALTDPAGHFWYFIKIPGIFGILSENIGHFWTYPNKYFQTKTVVSSVHNETRTCRRKSTDYILARRMRMQGQHPVNAEDIIVTQTLANDSIFINEDRSVIVLAREWASCSCATQNASASTERSEARQSHTSRCSRSTSFARTGRLFQSSTHFSETNALPHTRKCWMKFNDTQRDWA